MSGAAALAGIIQTKKITPERASSSSSGLAASHLFIGGGVIMHEFGAGVGRRRCHELALNERLIAKDGRPIHLVMRPVKNAGCNQVSDTCARVWRWQLVTDGIRPGLNTAEAHHQLPPPTQHQPRFCTQPVLLLLCCR